MPDDYLVIPPDHQTLACTFITFAIALRILSGKSIDCSVISGFMACTIMSFLVTFSVVFGFAEKLNAGEGIGCILVGLLVCRVIVFDFYYDFSDLWFNFGFFNLVYLVYCWTFSNINFLWALIIALTVIFGFLYLLFGGLFSGVRGPSVRQIYYDAGDDDWIYFDD
ncbi:MAG: hypothetical protein HC768_19210 [Acaryochloris sp. CRU_2_0]|nr:hypothetical protein [Acaryochloris sp. CRU_2_0]